MLNWCKFRTFYYLNFIILLCLSSSCSNNTDPKTIQKNCKELSKNVQLTLTPKTSQKWFKETLNAEENIFANNSLGIKLKLELEVSKTWIDSVKKLGYDAVFVNYICFKDGVKRYESKKDLNLSNRVHADKGEFISTARKCNDSYNFAYKDLQLHEGIHALSFGYSMHGVKFVKEKETQGLMYAIKKIDTTILASSIYDTKAASPCLYKVAITVSKFQIETLKHDVHNYDFSLGGTGMPDLYWDIFCGEKLTYCAPQIKNTANYNTTHTSDYFYCCQDDVITLNFADYDNGPFNTQDDLIASWQGKIKDLPTKNSDTLHYDKLNFAVFKASVLK